MGSLVRERERALRAASWRREMKGLGESFRVTMNGRERKGEGIYLGF